MENKEKKMNVQVETIKTEWFSMDYCQFGKGEKPLVILPGISVQSVMPQAEMIAEAYKILAQDFTVYVFDRRKGVLPESYTVKDMADDTVEAIEKLGLDQIDIFGASQGGMIAMEMAIHHPAMIHKMILGSTSFCVGDEQMRIFDEWMELARTGRATELYLLFGEEVYPEEVFEGAKQILTDASKTVTEEELARFMIMAEGMRGFDLRKDLGKITCPVLVIGSKDDRILGGEASVQMADSLKNSTDCELYLYDGFGHAVYDCAPDYKERLLDFLKK